MVIGGPRRDAPAPPARWRVLGEVSVLSGDGVLALRPQGRFVLGCLLREPGRPVPADGLIRADTSTTTDAAVAAGRVAVSRLRAVLAATGLDEDLHTVNGGYLLDIDPMTVDHIEFEQRLREAESIEWPDAAFRALDAALAAWDTPFGEWRADERFEARAQALEELHREAVDLWGELALRTGTHQRAVTALSEAVAAEPLRERRWASLMLAQYRSGNQSEALRAFERARATLRDEVGLDPGPALQELAAAILDHDPRLAWQPELRPTTSRQLRPLVRTSVVIGREAEITDLQHLLDRHRVVTVVGLGGIGKSSVAAEMVARSTRQAWVAPLAGVRDRRRIRRAVAESIGLSARFDDATLESAVFDKLRTSEALLVLDNCEHLADGLAAFVADLVAAAPSVHVLLTSRVELDVDGGRTFVLGPLATGTRDDPGPAALIAADAAMIGQSSIASQWDLVRQICDQAAGVPLALELVGAAVANGATPTSPAGTAIEDAVRTAHDALTDEARVVVEVLAAIPGTVSPVFLAEVLGWHEAATRRAIGQAIRAGLLLQRPGESTSRVALLEPARDHLLPSGAQEDEVVEMVRATLVRLARRCRPSQIRRFDESLASMLDDEHDTAMWAIERIDGDAQLELVGELGSIWAVCGRTADGLAWLDRLRDSVRSAPRSVQCRYWVVRGQMSPSFAARVPVVDELLSAVVMADEQDLTDVAARLRADAAVGLLWSGRFDEASAVLDAAETAGDEGDAWALLSVAKMRAVSVALQGDPAGAAELLLDGAEAFRSNGTLGDVAANLFLAAVSARLSGDSALVRRVFEAVDRTPIDRFSAYEQAALAFERAQFAQRQGDPDAGPLLWDALGQLTRYGEHRTAEVCRRELGRWRLAAGDRGGELDLVRAARRLLALDTNAAAVALAALVDGADGVIGDEAATLCSGVPVLLSAPGGGPLSADERGLLDSVSESDRGPTSLAELEVVLADLERRFSTR